MDASQLKAVEDLKKLISEDRVLAVPDEAAAVEAAAAFVAGAPAKGRPCELGADASKIAMGGVMGQCSAKNGKLMISI